MDMATTGKELDKRRNSEPRVTSRNKRKYHRLGEGKRFHARGHRHLPIQMDTALD